MSATTAATLATAPAGPAVPPMWEVIPTMCLLVATSTVPTAPAILAVTSRAGVLLPATAMWLLQVTLPAEFTLTPIPAIIPATMLPCTAS